MALVATYFETDGPDADKHAERHALEWLATLPPPHIYAVDGEERNPVICHIPVNDSPQPSKAMLQSAAGMPRSRQSRAFPTVIPQRLENQNDDDADITYEWRNATAISAYRPSLESLCRQVIRVGHSSSLVMAWTDERILEPSRDCWEPVDSAAEFTFRIAVVGELDRLQTACRADRIDQFANLKNEIESTTGRAQAAAKKRFADAFGEPYKASVRPPEPTPAVLGVWQGYRCSDDAQYADRGVHENSYFERDLLILAKHDGPALNVERTLGLTQALRAALIAVHGKATMPPWLCGHDGDGSPTSFPHAAFLGLPFAGSAHADGHIMGPSDRVAERRTGRGTRPLASTVACESGNRRSREATPETVGAGLA